MNIKRIYYIIAATLEHSGVEDYLKDMGYKNWWDNDIKYARIFLTKEKAENRIALLDKRNPRILKITEYEDGTFTKEEANAN